MSAPASTGVQLTSATSTLLLAFSSDPITRGCGRTVTTTWRRSPSSCAWRAPGTGRRHRGRHRPGEGAATWNPPGTSADEDALVDLLQRSIAAHRHIDIDPRRNVVRIGEDVWMVTFPQGAGRARVYLGPGIEVPRATPAHQGSSGS